MIEYIPLAVYLLNGAMDVPVCRVTTVVVNDDAAVFKGAQWGFAGGVADTGGLAPLHARIDEIIGISPLPKGSALVEKVLCLRGKPGRDSGFIQLKHAVLQFGAPGFKLSPVIICLPIVVHKDCGINAVAVEHHGIEERSLRTV